MLCAICGRERTCEHSVKLSVDQKTTLRDMTGKNPPDEFHYCGPCWRIVSDRERGAALMRGLCQTSLASMGRADAEKQSSKLYSFLIEKSKKGQVS